MTEKTLLLRQVHPNFVQDGEIGVVAFRPNDRDHGHLSVYDGDMISPKGSYEHWTDSLGKKSVGVLGVTVGECVSERLPALSSPQEGNPAHAHIDFSAFDKKEQRTRTKALLEFALARLWLFRPEV